MTAGDGPVLDVRTYRLVPGARDEFDRLFREAPSPCSGVTGSRSSPTAPLSRTTTTASSAPSVGRTATEQLDAFYGSDEWQQNHREAVLALIVGYHVVAIRHARAHGG